MKLFHLLFGIALLILFLWTGQHMRHTLHVGDMLGMERALFRAGHLYLLLSAVPHILLGTYFTFSKNHICRLGQWIGSILFVVSSLLLVYSFFVDLPPKMIERHHARLGLYGMLAGTLFHSVVPIIFRERKGVGF